MHRSAACRRRGSAATEADDRPSGEDVRVRRAQRSWADELPHPNRDEGDRDRPEGGALRNPETALEIGRLDRAAGAAARAAPGEEGPLDARATRPSTPRSATSVGRADAFRSYSSTRNVIRA